MDRGASSSGSITNLDSLNIKAIQYYNNNDFNNAIVLYEDLLAKQEDEWGYNNSKLVETLIQLGELYSLTDMQDISEYYFEQAIIISKESFQLGKNIVESPLLNLMRIYSFQNDTLMKKIVQEQLNSIAFFFNDPANYYQLPEDWPGFRYPVL